MDCLAPSPDALERVTIIEWLDKDRQITHVFNKPDDRIVLLPDDSLLRVLTKISAVLQKTSLPYAWNKKKSLLFTVKQTAWDGYSVNPFVVHRGGFKPQIKPVVAFHEKTLLGSLSRLNIVYSDAQEFAGDGHYFPEWKSKVPDVATILKEDRVMRMLLSYTVEEHLKLQRRDQSCTYSHIVFKGTAYKKQTSFTFLQDMFDRLHADSNIPFIQWMDDPSRILYKVYKHHEIASAMFDTWTATERLPKVKTALLLYSPIGKRSVYARVYISIEGDIMITYHMDARDKIDWATIEKHKDFVVSYVATFTGIKYDIQVNDISVRSELVFAQGLTMNKLASFMSGLLPIFHVLKVQQGKIEAIYKRASNYNDGIQLTEYIQSKLDMGITVPEIEQNLIEMGIAPAEARTYIEQAMNVEENVNMKKIETGTMIALSKVSYGVKVHITNASTIEEVQRIFHWIRACIMHLPQVSERNIKPLPKPVLSSSSSSSPPPLEKQTSSSSSSRKSNALAESVGSDDLDFLDGGAIGKEHQRYFLNMLQEADPGLFSRQDNNYARMCQASAFHQPVVLTLEEKDRMISEGYGEAIDNMITYGSDPNAQHAYFCPRIWCPAMKRPLTYEAYVRNGNKCPNGEEAKLMYEHPYWGNSPQSKHYIGFHKNKTSDGLCLPCCYVKPLSAAKEAECLNPAAANQQPKPKPKPAKPKVATEEKQVSPKKSSSSSSSSSSPASVSKDKDDAYLMTQVAPLPDGRNGSIPQVLHEIISPNVTYQLCSKTLTTQICPVRRGISHNNDSLMSAIAYSLQKRNKKELVEWIKKKLDPIHFLSLENGHIVTAFVDDRGMVPKEYKGLVKELMKHLNKYPKYVKLFGLADVQNDETRLSRELQIYSAYLKYFQYLESDEVKTPHHLYDLFKKLGYLLVVWDKETGTDVQLRCSMFTSARDLLYNVEQDRKTIMLLHENGVYEPIELRKRSADSIRVLDTKYTSTVDDALMACGAAIKNDVVLVLQSLVEWIKRSLFHPKPFRITTCVIAPDFKIHHLLTDSNVMILLREPLEIGALPRLADDVGITHSIYQEDIAGKVLTVQVLTADFDLFARKLRSVGLGYDMGRFVEGTMGYYNTQLTIPHPVVAPVIVVGVDNDLTRFAKSEDATQRSWYHLQDMISRTFIDHYDTLVVPLLGMNRADRVATLMNTFPSIPDKKKLRIAIEEMPLEHGKPALVAWAKLLGAERRFPFFDDTVKEHGKEWIFSQTAIERNDISHVVTPIARHGARPVASETPKKSHTEVAQNRGDAVNVTEPLPAILDPDQTTKERLPSKWTKMRAYEWAKYHVLRHRNYSRALMQELVEWIARMRQVPVFWGDIQFIRFKYVVGALQDEQSMLTLLEDPSLNHEFANVFGKSLRQPKQLWERISKRSGGDVKRIWNEIASSNRLWCSDLDLYVAAKLLNITILVLHRSKYGVSKENRKRGDFDDLAVSSSLYTHLYNKDHIKRVPICIFYKDTEDDHAVYMPITDQNNTFMFSSLYHCPKDIQSLVDFIITNDIIPSYK